LRRDSAENPVRVFIVHPQLFGIVFAGAPI
jgi:hypothetical protein